VNKTLQNISALQVRELFRARIVVGNSRYRVFVKALNELQKGRKKKKSKARVKASTRVYAHFQHFCNYLFIAGLKNFSVCQKKCHHDEDLNYECVLTQGNIYSFSCSCFIYREILLIAIIFKDFLKPAIN